MNETLTSRLDVERMEAERRRLLPPPQRRRQIRQSAGVSQEAIAEEVGVSRPAVAAYEAGTRSPRGEHLTRYLNVLNSLSSKKSA